MTAARKVLVVGAGSAGCAVAAFLARGGVEVDVVEIKDDVTALGSGITVQGNAMRVLRQLGVWDQVEQAGFGFPSTGFRSKDGSLLGEMADVRTGGPDLPATMGMERTKLAAILVGAAEQHGAGLRFGLTVDALVDDGDAGGVDIRFSDGSTGCYDLVVGADGNQSRVRGLIGIVEVATAAVILVPRTAAYAAATIVVIMIGAIGTVATHDRLIRILPAAIVLVLASVVLLARWRQRLVITGGRHLAPLQ